MLSDKYAIGNFILYNLQTLPDEQEAGRDADEHHIAVVGIHFDQNGVPRRKLTEAISIITRK